MKKIILFAAALAVLTGCKTVEYVPVVEHEVHHDSIYFTKVQYDSIYVKDSTNQKEYNRGDTLVIERTKWQTLYKYKLVHDTLYQSKTDSIPVPYPVIKEVEKKLTKMQKGLMGLGLLTLLVIIIYVAFRLKKFLP